jgi:Ca-activated chloride channel family protein
MKFQYRLSNLWLICLGLFVIVATTAVFQGCANRPRSVTALPEGYSTASSQGFFPGSSIPAGSFPPSVSEQILVSGLRNDLRFTRGPITASTDEIWVLARGEGSAAVSDDTPGTGTLMAKIEQKEIPMPLKHTDVHASISGYISTVEVTQQFLNPYSAKIEATYVFPLPHNASVNEFIMTIGDRRIRGIIRERKEAEKIYAEAKQQGHVASLLTEERPNVFTQHVANLEPGKQIDVNIKYFHALEYVDGWYEFVFPMVVGPRFNPTGSTNGIGAVGRGGSGELGQPTEVHYLNPSERTSADISLKVDVDAGVTIEQFESKTPQVIAEQTAPERLTLSLASADSLSNKDFVLRFRVAGEQIKSTLLTHRDERGGFFTLMLYPPKELHELKRQPLELVFVLDCSGSMDGRPIEQAKAAVQRGLHLLQPNDSFQLITFSMTASTFGRQPLEATPENIRRASHYLHSLNGEGGTMMLEGIKAALDFPHDPARLRFVCFLTDGFIGNESEILGEIHRRLGSARIFSFGIGSRVNCYLIEHMAKAGNGTVAYLGLNESAANIMEDFFSRISHPAMTDLKMDWGGLHVSDVFPSKLPDLFVGRPVIVSGRFAGKQEATIRVNGMSVDRPIQVAIPAPLDGTEATHVALPSVWAGMKMAELAEQSTYRPARDLPEAIKRVALDCGLISPFTAFVAVDSTHRTHGSEAVTVPVAVPVPEGVKYKNTVDEK